ncbi:protein ENHANCED PSEUDOMONAS SUSCEPTIBILITY 1-like [Salvia hispanica]|uniref:protein ENHANCED PSEUDOMONAS SUSCEPTIBILITY 1-like n=1 Tax=Salvia hispanica TaxID=49212 RepID=UPI0020092A6E|nr:protein ENHANCED PSEUDOMONAS SUSCEPTIBILITY 1-like [Salvia hispanica]
MSSRMKAPIVKDNLLNAMPKDRLEVSGDASVLTVADVNESGTDLAPALFPLPGIRNKDGASQPLLAVQVMNLGDGSFVGFTLNHLLCDGTAFWYFVNSWVEISRSSRESISTPPILSRDQLLMLMSTKIFRVFSSLQAVITHLWRSMIRCHSAGLSEETTFEFPMGTRWRISPPLPDEYFGNAIIPGFINRMVNSTGPEKVKEFFSGWAKEPKFVQFDTIPTNRFILINSLRFDVYGNDFRWGPPVAARSGRGSSFDGRVTVFAGPDGSLEVEDCLLKETLCAMAEDVEFMEFVTTVEN